MVGTVCTGAFLGQLDASIAGLVLPTLERAFVAPVASVEWVAIAYLLTLAALVVPVGRMGDLVGRKVLYTFGFVVFVVGSALCGLAPSLTWLVAFRVGQAVGAAMLQANSVAIITAAVPRRALGRAIGVQGAAQAVGLSVGPSVGGLLIDSLGWQWVFFIAVPFGILGTVLAWFVLPSALRAPAVGDAALLPERFDWAGAALLGPSVGLLLLGLTYGNDWGWTSPALLATAGLATACVSILMLVEAHFAWPLIDPRLLRVPSFSRGLAAGLLAYAVLFGSLFVVPFYLERILGQSAAQTGLLLTPVPIALGVMAPIAGTLTDRVGPGRLTVLGMVIAAVALAGLGLAPETSLTLTLGLLALLGAGLGLFTPPNNSAVMGSAPANRLGVAGGILNMTRSVGTGLGVAAAGAVLTVRLSARFGARVDSTLDAPLTALLPAFHDTLLFLAGVAVLAALVSSARNGEPWLS